MVFLCSWFRYLFVVVVDGLSPYPGPYDWCSNVQERSSFFPTLFYWCSMSFELRMRTMTVDSRSQFMITKLKWNVEILTWRWNWLVLWYTTSEYRLFCVERLSFLWLVSFLRPLIEKNEQYSVLAFWVHRLISQHDIVWRGWYRSCPNALQSLQRTTLSASFTPDLTTFLTLWHLTTLILWTCVSSNLSVFQFHTC